jgi:cytochrome c-type biogenesis protein CcmH/NrfG
VKRAEEQLLLVVDEDPKYVEAHFLLGSMYLSSGLKARALSKFKKVVELAPDHEEAKALVAEMAPEPPPEPPPNGGIVKRLFGKGS